MRARQFVLHTHYSMYRRCPQRWRIATVATDTPPNLLPVQGLYCRLRNYDSKLCQSQCAHESKTYSCSTKILRECLQNPQSFVSVAERGNTEGFKEKKAQ